MSRFGEQELRREGRRVLRRLSQGYVLVRGDDGFVAVRPGASPKGARIKVAADLVEALGARGLLAVGGGDVRLSPAGRIWYARQDGSENPFAAQHRTMASHTLHDSHGDEVPVAVNLGESPLSLLQARGLISPLQFEAGERLRADYTKGQLTPHLCVDLTAVARGRGAPREVFSDIVLAARQRFRAAMAAAGPGLSDVLYDVCCALHGLEAVEKGRAWPRSSAKVVLRLGLDRLAHHYGFDATAVRAATRVWSAAEAPDDGPG